MPADEIAAAIQAAAARRLAQVDSLLPAQAPSGQAFTGLSGDPPCDVRFSVSGAGGEPVAEPPSAATWIAPLAGLPPVAYLTSAYVEETERGAGIGQALTAEFHRTAESEGVGVVLLHYELLNPRSGPFWARQGYRPLWIALEARPANRLIGHSI